MSEKGHKLLAAGTATLIAEPAFALAHQGTVGVILGLAAGAAAYALVTDVEQMTGRSLALPARKRRETKPVRSRPSGKLHFAHRLLVGKSVREAEAAEAATDEEAEDETVFVEEDEDLAPQDLLELGWNRHP